jgi:hypothetical protein
MKIWLGGLTSGLVCVVVLTACATTPEAKPGAISDRVTDWQETGHWPYDYGYGFGRLLLVERELIGEPISYCSGGAEALKSGEVLDRQILIEAYLEGCMDALKERMPSHTPLGDYGTP